MPLIYTVLFAAAFIENFFPPFPGDVAVVFGGFLAGQRLIDPYTTFGIASAGSLCSIMVIYQIARIKGRSFLLQGGFRFIKQERIAQLEDAFARHGEKVILLSRFMLGIRSAIVVLAGVAGVKPAPMLCFSGIGVIIWNAILVYTGFALGENWQFVLEYLKMYNRLIIVALILLTIFYLIRKYGLKPE